MWPQIQTITDWLPCDDVTNNRERYKRTSKKDYQVGLTPAHKSFKSTRHDTQIQRAIPGLKMKAKAHGLQAASGCWVKSQTESQQRNRAPQLWGTEFFNTLLSLKADFPQSSADILISALSHSENPPTLSTSCFKLGDNYTAKGNSYIIPTTEIQNYLDLVLKEKDVESWFLFPTCYK